MQISSLSSSSLAPIIVRNTVIYAGHGRNIRLTWEAELAQLLPSEATSKSCDKPLTQVEAIVRSILILIIFSYNILFL